MANVKHEFSRGMEVVYNVLKDGKPHSRATIKAALLKHKIKKGIFGRCFRLGRMLRAEGSGDVIIVRNADAPDKSTAQLVTGSAAKKSIAEKKDRYSGLAHHKSKKSAKKATAKKSTSKKSATKKASTKKTAAKKHSAKKVAVTAGGSGGEESAAPSES